MPGREPGLLAGEPGVRGGWRRHPRNPWGACRVQGLFLGPVPAGTAAS